MKRSRVQPSLEHAWPADGLPPLPSAFLQLLDAVVPASMRAESGDGRLYIQGLSSMAAVWVLNPQPGEEILDLAAVEPVKARFHRLKANLQRLRAGHVHTWTAVWSAN